MITLLGWNGGQWEVVFNDLGTPLVRKVFCFMYRESEVSSWKRFPSLFALAAPSLLVSMKEQVDARLMLANPRGEPLDPNAMSYWIAATERREGKTPTQLEMDDEHSTKTAATGSSGSDSR